LTLVEAGLLGPLADEYRNRNWEGWDYVLKTMESLLQAPIPPDKRHDLEFLLRAMMKIPVQFGPSRGQRRNERVVDRVVEVLLPIWNGEVAEWDLTLERLSRIDHPTLLLYESSSVFYRSCEVLSERLPNCKSVRLDGSHLDDSNIKHFTLMEIPEQLVGHTRAFLNSEAVAAGSGRS